MLFLSSIRYGSQVKFFIQSSKQNNALKRLASSLRSLMHYMNSTISIRYSKWSMDSKRLVSSNSRRHGTLSVSHRENATNIWLAFARTRTTIIITVKRMRRPKGCREYQRSSLSRKTCFNMKSPCRRSSMVWFVMPSAARYIYKHLDRMRMMCIYSDTYTLIYQWHVSHVYTYLCMVGRWFGLDHSRAILPYIYIYTVVMMMARIDLQSHYGRIDVPIHQIYIREYLHTPTSCLATGEIHADAPASSSRNVQSYIYIYIYIYIYK